MTEAIVATVNDQPTTEQQEVLEVDNTDAEIEHKFDDSVTQC
jgi:hypothetical protein